MGTGGWMEEMKGVVDHGEPEQTAHSSYCSNMYER